MVTTFLAVPPPLNPIFVNQYIVDNNFFRISPVPLVIVLRNNFAGLSKEVITIILKSQNQVNEGFLAAHHTLRL